MRKRISLFSLLITVVGILIFSIVSTEVYYNTTVNNSEEYLKVYMNIYDEKIYSLDGEGANALSSKLGGARVTFMQLDGTIIADSGNATLSTNHADRPEVIDAIKTGEGFSTRSSKTVGKNLSYYCKKFDNFLVRVSIPTPSEWGIFAKSLPTIAWFLCLDVLVCLISTYFATSYILRPVEELTKQAALNRKISAKYPELDQIVGIMNGMNDKIAEKIEEINEEKELVLKANTSKNEFISNITHEMNTPLTSIKGFAELLETDNLPFEQRKKAVKTILAQSERLTNLIACVINYNEIDNDALPSYDVDISKIATELLETLRPDIEKKNIKVINNIEQNVIIISRHERISEIVGNLIRNAVKYNVEGGELEVVIQGGSMPCLVVRDTGIGISKENHEKVFDRFFTVDKSHSGKNGGFGLGLAVVKKLCKKANWKLSFESELGKGSTFIINFN